MNWRTYVIIALAAVLLVIGYIVRFRHDSKVDAKIVSAALPPEDKEKIIPTD